MPPMRMVHEKDPAQVIFDKIGMKKPGVLRGFRLMGSRVLVGIYERPQKTQSGIYLADQTRKEDEHQGKAAVVLMKGRAAFISDDNVDFGDDNVEVGDWVSVFIQDGRKIMINGQLCRIVSDQDIAMKIPAPDSVY